MFSSFRIHNQELTLYFAREGFRTILDRSRRRKNDIVEEEIGEESRRRKRYMKDKKEEKKKKPHRCLGRPWP